MQTIKVGDAVAWADVPDEQALVRDSSGLYIKRDRLRAFMVADGELAPREFRGTGYERFTIVSLGLSGQESADDLRRRAEVFEVREALQRGRDAADNHNLADSAAFVWVALTKFYNFRMCDVQWHAERLHAAGWRPGMTSEDAARLLSEAAG